MIQKGVLRSGLILVILLVAYVKLTCAGGDFRGLSSVCELKSVKDLILGDGFDGFCLVSGNEYGFGVIEGDETSLHKAISGIGTNTHEYVVVLFYASWCPFSTILRPSLSTMSSLYPSIPHFAIEESTVKPSILSKYGVNGFPTLFVLNSTMRVRYHGSRTLSSLVNFYTDVTGVEAELVDTTSKLDTFMHDKGNNVSEPETCPFTWAKSPENLLRQETYLALATLFVVLRSLYLSYPFIITSAQYARRTQFLNIRVRSLWEHPFGYLNRAILLFSSLTCCMGFGFFHERKH